MIPRASPFAQHVPWPQYHAIDYYINCYTFCSNGVGCPKTPIPKIAFPAIGTNTLQVKAGQPTAMMNIPRAMDTLRHPCTSRSSAPGAQGELPGPASGSGPDFHPLPASRRGVDGLDDRDVPASHLARRDGGASGNQLERHAVKLGHLVVHLGKMRLTLRCL